MIVYEGRIMSRAFCRQEADAAVGDDRGDLSMHIVSARSHREKNIPRVDAAASTDMG